MLKVIVSAKLSVCGISSTVKCIIKSQATKKQARLEFTVRPSLSHSHSSGLHACDNNIREMNESREGTEIPVYLTAHHHKSFLIATIIN